MTRLSFGQHRWSNCRVSLTGMIACLWLVALVGCSVVPGAINAGQRLPGALGDTLTVNNVHVQLEGIMLKQTWTSVGTGEVVAETEGIEFALVNRSQATQAHNLIRYELVSASTRNVYGINGAEGDQASSSLQPNESADVTLFYYVNISDGPNWFVDTRFVTNSGQPIEWSITFH